MVSTQDYSTSLELKRWEKRGFLFIGMEERGGLYNSSEKNMNGMSFNKGWQRIKKKNHEPRPYFRL